MRRQIGFGIIGIIFIISCKSNYNKQNSEDLECIIDTYISVFSIKLGNEISLFESHEWTDTTLNLSISSIKSTRLSSGKYFYTEYNGTKLFLQQGRLYRDSKGLQLELFEDAKMMIPNSLKWKTIELSNLEEEFFPPEEFNEVQIIFNPSKKCVQDSEMTDRLKFKEVYKKRCYFCKYSLL